MGKVGKVAMAAKITPVIPLKPKVGLRARLQGHTALVQAPPFGKSSPFVGFQVSGRIDQNGRRWVEIISGTNRCTVPLELFSTAPNDVLRKINSAGILVINDQAKTYLKNQVQEIPEWTDIYIADRRGPHNNCFVLTHDFVVGREADRQKIHIELNDESVKWTKRGTQAEWLPTAKLMVGQSRPIFLASFAFVPPLLSIVPGFLNIGIELVGPPGLGKSTVAQWAASIFGGDPARLTRFLESWATTLNALEPTIRAHSYALLGLDELNLIGSLDDIGVRRLLESAVFRLCYGVEKRRYGTAIQPHSDRLCWLSTSNIPIAQVLAGFAPGVAEAAAQRLLTIPAEVSEFGIFDRLPPGVANSSELVERLVSATDQCFGIPIRAFLLRFQPACHDNEAQLCAEIERRIRLFLQIAATDLNHGPSVRVAKAFALIYAAGWLAQYWRVLPAEWSIGPAVMQCYRAHLSLAQGRQTSHRTSLIRIMDYARQHRGEFVDLRGGMVEMDDATFAQTYGFLKRTSAGRLELLIPPQRMHREFPDYRRLMQELRDQSHARVEGGTQPKLTTKAAVRRNKPLDRVYCIVIGSAL